MSLCFRFLRREKDIIAAKFEMVEAESQRLKQQLQQGAKQLEETKAQVLAEQEKAQVSGGWKLGTEAPATPGVTQLEETHMLAEWEKAKIH